MSELDSIFNQHLNNESIFNIKVHSFDKETILKNHEIVKKIEKLENYHKNAFYDKEDDYDNDEDEDDEMIENLKKQNDYFKEIKKNTKEHDYLYCGYIDDFDKMFVKNKNDGKKGKILSCVGCFNQVCYKARNLTKDLLQSNEMESVIIDNRQNLNETDVKKILKGPMIMNQFDNDSIYNIVLCSSCKSDIAVYDTNKNQYYIYNAI